MYFPLKRIVLQQNCYKGFKIQRQFVSGYTRPTNQLCLICILGPLQSMMCGLGNSSISQAACTAATAATAVLTPDVIITPVPARYDIKQPDIFFRMKGEILRMHLPACTRGEKEKRPPLSHSITLPFGPDLKPHTENNLCPFKDSRTSPNGYLSTTATTFLCPQGGHCRGVQL